MNIVQEWIAEIRKIYIYIYRYACTRACVCACVRVMQLGTRINKDP